MLFVFFWPWLPRACGLMGLATVTLARSEGFVLRALETSIELLPTVDDTAARTGLPLEIGVRRPDMDEAADEVALPRIPFLLCNSGYVFLEPKATDIVSMDLPMHAAVTATCCEAEEVMQSRSGEDVVQRLAEDWLQVG